MPRLPPRSPHDAGGADDLLLRTIAAAPPLAQSLAQHAGQVMEGGLVSPLTKALCAAMVAGLTYCQPELTAQRRRARALGADTHLLNELWDYAASERFTEQQKAALAAAVALTREPRALPDAVWNDLRRSYDDAQIVELLCTIGLANYLDRLSNALQTDITRE